MKPFDLEAAKRGDPIVTEDNEKVLFIGLDSNGNVVAEDSEGWLIKYRTTGIFMAPKKRTVWVNLYPDFRCSAYHYETEKEADDCGLSARIGGKAYPVEIEE